MPVQTPNALLPLSVKTAQPITAFQNSQTRGIQNDLLQARTGQVEFQTQDAQAQREKQEAALLNFQGVLAGVEEFSPQLNAIRTQEDLNGFILDLETRRSSLIEQEKSTKETDQMLGLARAGDLPSIRANFDQVLQAGTELQRKGIGLPPQRTGQSGSSKLAGTVVTSEGGQSFFETQIVAADGTVQTRRSPISGDIVSRLTGESASTRRSEDVQQAGETVTAKTQADLALADEQAEAAALQAAAVETSKLSAQLKLKPEIDAAAKTAVARATLSADAAKENRSNQRVLQIYDVAVTSLAEALGDTFTGPVAGLMPAITANQQIADGAVAAIAPVLKQLFRAAGEGIFTDKDQELLLKMVPTRTDLPDARAAKLLNIDAIVRAKLAPLPADNADAGNQPVVVDFSELPQ